MFLRKLFPDWRSDKTYMIPYNFTGDPVVDGGEDIIYSLLKQLGDLDNIGMFVIHGFQLKDIPKFNKECRSKVPTILLKGGVSDFIIFHHTIGIISLEIINSLKISDRAVLDAENKLKTTHNLITKLAAFDSSDIFYLPHKKIIAMPINKKDFNHDDFSSLEEDTLLLFAKDSQNIKSFQKWWQETLVTLNPVHLAGSSQEAYEKALSYALMIRHLGPVTETNFLSYFHESLVSNKYHAFQHAFEEAFPEFWSWLWAALGKKDKQFDFEQGKVDELKAFMKSHDMKIEELRSLQGIKVINDLLKEGKYISDALAVVFEDTPSLVFRHILRFISDMWQIQTQVSERKTTERSKALEKYPFLELKSLEDLKRLDQHLSRFTFIEGDTPNVMDQELFKTLTCQTRMKHSRLPMIMTSDQLAVFEGPLKQLIIGPPGSGKTELMKFKALELELEMKICNEKKKILYIVANGSPDYSNKDSLLFYHISEFFKTSTLIEVITIILDNDSEDDLRDTVLDLRERIASGMYSHVFVDEYWIGSKPDEHMIMKELVTGISGYVWISSVHEYSNHPKHTEKISLRTDPLIATLNQSGGAVNRITKVLRATNAIVDVERSYTDLYKNRSYPFGTKQVLGHSFEGLPVTWAVEDDVDGMYTRCTDIVASAMGFPPSSGERLTLYPDDILIVNFAIRTKVAQSVKRSLKEYLTDKKIPVWTFGESLDQFTNCGVGKVTLMESLIREASCYLDGVEWPMVVIILPSNLLINKAEIADRAQKLRNYDPFISFFRAMVKLVVISDKWKDKEEFLADLAEKEK